MTVPESTVDAAGRSTTPVGAGDPRPPAPTGSTSIVWFCVNLRDGGMAVTPELEPLLHRHGVASFDWLRHFPDIVGLSPIGPPDVIFLQEGKYFDQHGDELLLFVERQLRLQDCGAYRGFLTRLRRSPHHQVIFINTARLQAVHHWHGADPDEPAGLYGFVEVIVDGDRLQTLWLKSVHLDPRDGDARLAEAKQIEAAVPIGQRALIAGDFNSITSRRSAAEGEPQPDFSQVPPRVRYRSGAWPRGEVGADTRAVDYFIDCEWMCQHIADGNVTPTTLPTWERGGALIIDRCLATVGLRTLPGSVWVDTSTTPYSDHRAFGGAVLIGDGSAA